MIDLSGLMVPADAVRDNAATIGNRAGQLSAFIRQWVRLPRRDLLAILRIVAVGYTS
jgi:hypothetical protein